MVGGEEEEEEEGDKEEVEEEEVEASAALTKTVWPLLHSAASGATVRYKDHLTIPLPIRRHVKMAPTGAPVGAEGEVGEAEEGVEAMDVEEEEGVGLVGGRGRGKLWSVSFSSTRYELDERAAQSRIIIGLFTKSIKHKTGLILLNLFLLWHARRVWNNVDCPES